MKKFLALSLAAVLLVCALASCTTGLGDPNAIDDYTPEVDYLMIDGNTFRFEEAEGETAILVEYIGKATSNDHVVIPEKFNDRTVTAIGDEAFYNLAAIVEVTIPATVTKIGKYAFAACTELTAINLPEGTLEIDEYAFARCDKLTTINVGNSLLSIGAKAFWDCTALTTINLPSTLETIEEAAFWNCTSLTALEIPASVKEIGDLAYYNCTGLETIKLHDGIEKLGGYIFVTDGSTLKDKIDVSNLAEDSKVLEYVNNIADPTPETEAPDAEETEPSEE